MKRSAAVSVAYGFGVGLLALVVVCAHCRAHAQSANLMLCDRVAADPADPDKPADLKGTVEIAPSDVATAIKFCKAAAASSPRALYELGRAYAANQQLPDAIAAYRKAADKGSTSAMVELGLLFANGAGVAKDEAQARSLFERAAEAGNARGVINLMAMSSNGGPPLDPVKARAWLTQAAQTNLPEAEFQLGLMNANGVGGPKDDAAARALFERAAAQNHPAALEWMGSFAESGRGGPKDAAAAKAYYQRAAALGDDNAKVALKRLECPIELKDKRGNTWGHMCL